MGADGADRRGGAVDGRLSGELPRADARGCRHPARTGPARRAAERRAADRGPSGAGRGGARPGGRGGASLMLNNFILTLPEEIIGTGALVLMLAAAWTGDRGAP